MINSIPENSSTFKDIVSIGRDCLCFVGFSIDMEGEQSLVS